MSETWSEIRDTNTCLVGSGTVRSGSVCVCLVEFGLKNLSRSKNAKKKKKKKKKLL